MRMGKAAVCPVGPVATLLSAPVRTAASGARRPASARLSSNYPLFPASEISASLCSALTHRQVLTAAV